MSIRKFSQGSVVALAIAAVLQASALAGDSSVKFDVTLSPAGSFTAESSAVAVQGSAVQQGDAYLAKDIVLDLRTLKTGIELRDHHMNEKYFETGKYPTAVLTEAQGKDGKFTGTLKLHNVSRKIAGEYKVEGGKFNAKFSTKLSDFQIKQVKYMGVGVEDEVAVQVALPVKGAKK